MARTKRKVNPIAAEPPIQAAKEAKRYKTAGYARLSVEDSGKPGSETLDGQKRLIMDYIESSPDMEFVSMFYDNGETGTDFKRPGFESLMTALRKGEVNCIVVKDLSRFGRNYKETGNYLERIFPFLGVRFIAITDSFDTLTAERGANGFIIPLKNLINETYSRDISKKISSALHVKQDRGEFIGAWAPYGYSKDPEDKHRLVPNPETAPNVQRIFQMRRDGVSCVAIARKLNDEGISSPSRYLVESGMCRNSTYANSVWKVQIIKSILSRQVYIGHMVQGVKRQSFHDGKKVYYPPKDEWAVVLNTHTPIVDEETFSIVQDMEAAAHQAYFDKLGKFDELGKTENILRGLIYCADCGRPLVRYKNVSHGKKLWYTFICPTHANDPRACPLKNIREDELLQVVQEAVSKQIALAVDMEQLAVAVSNTPANRKLAATVQEQLEQETKALRRCESLRDSLYQSYVEKLMTEREYVSMKERYAAEAVAHNEKITELKHQIEDAKKYSSENKYLASFSIFRNASVLSRDVLTALIERIELGANNQISIRFRYRDEFDILNEHLRKEAAPDEYRSKVSSHIE